MVVGLSGNNVGSPGPRFLGLPGASWGLLKLSGTASWCPGTLRLPLWASWGLLVFPGASWCFLEPPGTSWGVLKLLGIS